MKFYQKFHHNKHINLTQAEQTITCIKTKPNPQQCCTSKQPNPQLNYGVSLTKNLRKDPKKKKKPTPEADRGYIASEIPPYRIEKQKGRKPKGLDDPAKLNARNERKIGRKLPSEPAPYNPPTTQNQSPMNYSSGGCDFKSLACHIPIEIPRSFTSSYAQYPTLRFTLNGPENLLANLALK